MLGTKIEGRLSAAGHQVSLSPSLAEAPLDEVELIVADLDVENPEALVGLGVPVLGFYSHVDVETRRAPRPRASTWSCRARGWRASFRSWSRRCSP